LIGALLKLPPVTRLVYRGVKKNLIEHFQNGKRKIWWSFGSTTISVNVLQSEQFLGKEGERTMFNISAKSARDISRFSAIRSEQELLLLPGTVLIVDGVLDLGNNCHIVQLNEILVTGLIDLDPVDPLLPSNSKKFPTKPILQSLIEVYDSPSDNPTIKSLLLMFLFL